MCAQTFEVPVGLGWVHFGHLCQDAHGTIGPLTGRLSEGSGHHFDLFLREGPGFWRRPRRRAHTIIGRVDAFVDHRGPYEAVEKQLARRSKSSEGSIHVINGSS